MSKLPPVSIHPYFQAHPGKMAAIREILSEFTARTDTETGVLQYQFLQNGETIFCRESYGDAAATLAHLQNVGETLGRMLEQAELVRLEIHGPASELAKLKEPLSHLPVEWFEYVCGIER